MMDIYSSNRLNPPSFDMNLKHLFIAMTGHISTDKMKLLWMNIAFKPSKEITWMIQKIFREKQNSEAKISIFMTNEQI